MAIRRKSCWNAKKWELSDKGYNSEDLDKISKIFEEKEIERINLVTFLENENYNGEKAELLIIRNAQIIITKYLKN